MESFEIIERYVTKRELLLLAKTILLAQDLIKASLNNVIYTKTTRDACKEAVKSTLLEPFWITSMTYWLTYHWNESQEWAKQIIKESK